MGGSPWSNQVQNKIIISGPGGGLFVYQPTPAKNNLVETAGLTTAGHDQFGNTTLPGDVQYMNQAGTYYALQMTGGTGAVPQIRWLVSSGDQTGTYTQLFVVGYAASAGLTGIDLGSAAAFANPPQCFSAPLLAQNPTTPASGAETWHALTPSGSWANFSGEAIECRLMPDNTVAVHGVLVIPSGVTGPANTMTNVPAGYRPATRSEPCVLTETLAASPFTATAHDALVRTSGNIDVFGAATLNNNMNIQIRYPLDGS